MLAERIKQVIERKFFDRHRFLWVVDPFGIASPYLRNLFPNLAIHRYSNPIDFRIFYEPLRERMEEDKPANAIIVSESEKQIPPDVKRYSLPLIIKPSQIFPSLHPIVDEILVSRKLVEQFAPSYDDLPRGREETLGFVLRAVLEVPIPTSPSPGEAFAILMNYHLRGEGLPRNFLRPYLGSLEGVGFSPDELFDRENLLEVLRQLLLLWVEERANIRLEEWGIEERARKIYPYIKLEPNRLTSEVWERLDWRRIGEKIPLPSIPSLLSPLLPQDFHSFISGKIIEQLSKNRRDSSALESARALKREDKASEELGRILAIVDFLAKEFSLPQESEDIPKVSQKWLELGRKIALQWRNVMKSMPANSPLRDSPLREEWETLLDRANREFVNFVLRNYPQWIKGKPRPTLSCDVLSQAVLPYLGEGLPVYLLVIDGMTYAQWAVMEDWIRGEMSGYNCQDGGCFSILPSATIFSRNALFAGALPREIAEKYGRGYLRDNEGEEEMLKDWIERNAGRGKKVIYCKGRDWDKAIKEEGDLKVFILNFADEITHLTGKVAESEEELLALVETAYRFRPFSQLLSAVRGEGAVLVITSDHGSIWVQRAERIGREEHEEAKGRSNRFYELANRPKEKIKDALYLSESEAPNWGLPGNHYLIAYGYFMFSGRTSGSKIAVHGGISLWEMCIPLLIFTPQSIK